MAISTFFKIAGLMFLAFVVVVGGLTFSRLGDQAHGRFQTNLVNFSKKIVTGATTISWSDLVPKDFEPTAQPLIVDHSGQPVVGIENQPDFDQAPVVQELDGQTVRLPGYILPLDAYNGETEHFLLVPFFGACIHVPPPPPNQIVQVKSKEPVSIRGLFDPVWVTGVMAIEKTDSMYARSAYLMSDVSVEPYDE